MFKKMINKRSLSIFAAAAAFTLAAATAQAGLMIDVVPGNPTTGPFAPISPPTDALLSEFNGIQFEDANGDPLVPLTGGTTDPASGVVGDNWWNPLSFPIFTTDSHTIEIDLSALNVFGFSFQIGANQRASGWVAAYINGETETHAARRNNIAMNTSNSPGIQITNTRGSCDRITKVVVEPPFTWGIFNMGMDTVGNDCAQVPEPGSLSLLGAGLLGLGLLQRRRRKTAAVAV